RRTRPTGWPANLSTNRFNEKTSGQPERGTNPGEWSTTLPGHGDRGGPGQMHHGGGPEEPVELPGELALPAWRPAEKSGPGALQRHHLLGGQDGWLLMGPGGRRPELAGGGDGLGVGRPPLPRAAGVAVPDPQGLEGRVQRLAVTFFCAEQGQPAARPQQPGRLGERD